LLYPVRVFLDGIVEGLLPRVAMYPDREVPPEYLDPAGPEPGLIVEPD
jgi:hypothetical protein